MEWLLQQSPIIVSFGIGLIYMYRYLLRKDKLIQSKDKVIMELAEKAIAAIESSIIKSEVNSKEHERIDKKLDVLIERK